MSRIKVLTSLRGLSCGLALLMASGGCSDASGPTLPPRMLAVFTVDGVSIPALFSCENAGDADSAAFRFNDGMLVLYRDGAFRWEYSVSHVAWIGGARTMRTDHRAVAGVHDIRDGTVKLLQGHTSGHVITVTMREGWFEMTHPRECPAGNASRQLTLRLET